MQNISFYLLRTFCKNCSSFRCKIFNTVVETAFYVSRGFSSGTFFWNTWILPYFSNIEPKTSFWHKPFSKVAKAAFYVSRRKFDGLQNISQNVNRIQRRCHSAEHNWQKTVEKCSNVLLKYREHGANKTKPSVQKEGEDVLTNSNVPDIVRDALTIIKTINPQLPNTSPLPTFRPRLNFRRSQIPVSDTGTIPLLQRIHGKKRNCYHYQQISITIIKQSLTIGRWCYSSRWIL